MGGVARGSTANLVGLVVLATSTMGLTVAVTRTLSREAAGVFFSTTAVFVLATVIGQLGTNTGLVYFLSRARGAGDLRLVGHYLRLARRPVLVVATGMAVLLFVFAPQISGVVNPDHVQQSTQYLRALAVFIPLAGLENVTLAATRGLGSMRANVVVEQLGRPTLQVALVLLALAAGGSTLLAPAWAAAYLPAAVAAWWWWRRTGARIGGQVVTRPASLRRDFWRFTGPRALASVAQSAMQRLDIILVAALAGATAAAVYTAATRFLVVGQMGTRAISLAVQPRLGAALGRGDLAEAEHYYRTSTAWLVLITWPLFLLCVVFGEQLLAVFGPGYRSGADVVLLLSLSMLVATGCGMVDMVLNMAGRTSWNMWNVFLSMGVQMGLDVLLIPRYGIFGAAVGWAAAIALANLVPLAQIGFVMGLHPFGRATVVAGSLAAGCFGAVPALARQVFGPSWAGLLVGASVGLLLYAPLLWRLRKVLELTALRGIRRGS